MKKIALFLSVIAMSTLFFGCNKPDDGKAIEQFDYDVFGLSNLAIGLWVTPPEGFMTEDYYREMSEMGINIVNGFPYHEKSEQQIKNVLDYSHKYGMKFLVAQMQIENNIKAYQQNPSKALIDDSMELIKKYADHPAFAGSLFLDEPGRGMFSALDDFIKEYEKQFPGKPWYVNMLPMYATGAIGTSTYEEYIEEWIRITNPKFVSFDFYPLLTYDTTAPNIRYELEDYYYNLDLLRHITKKAGLPYWGFVSTLEITEATVRDPSREDLRWQVFSHLAFGAKGIQYFCYWTPGSLGGTAIIDMEGNKTEKYDWAKELNEEILTYGQILLNSHAEGVMFHDIRKGAQNIYSAALTNFGPIAAIDGNRYVAGCFTDQRDGTKSVLISPTTPRDNISVTINFKQVLSKVTAYIGGVKQQLDVNGTSLTLNINKGDAVLIQF